MKTSWKPLGRNWQQSLRGGESIEDDGRSGRPKDATADEHFKVAHIVPAMCDKRRDLRSIASEVGIRFGAVRTINPNRHLRYVKGFGKLGATNVDR